MSRRSLLRSASLATVVATHFSVGATAQTVVTYHDFDLPNQIVQRATLTVQGYRPVDLAIYGTTSSPRYAATWVLRAGPAFEVFDARSASQFQALMSAKCNTHSLQSVSVLGSATQPIFAGVLVQSTNGCYVRHGLTASEFESEVSTARGNGWRIASFEMYGSGSGRRYVVSFEPNPEQFAQGYFFSSGVATHGAMLDAMKQHWGRPRHFGSDDTGFYQTAVWEASSVGDFKVHHDLTAQQFSQINGIYENIQWYPTELSASGAGSNRRFVAVWAPTDIPRTRQWTMTGAGSPGLAAFDTWVRNHMQKTATRAASLAIVKDAKLVLARGYTWAEAGYTKTQPTSRFRIASCSKPLTSILVHRRMAKDPALHPGAKMAAFFGNPTMADARANDITIQHLMTHRAGWDRTDTGSNFDPMFIDQTVATALNRVVPVTPTHIRQYMQAQPLDFSPGTAREYSNYGFSLLGRILETRQPGKTYQQILQEEVFDRLGITRAVLGGGARANQLADEVVYHPNGLWLSQSVLSPLRPWVARPYGSWNQRNLDAHGGHVMSATDYAKVLAAFDVKPFNPLLTPAQIGSMWADVPGNGSWVRGWFKANLAGPSGTLQTYWHNGILGGSSTLIARRQDGVSFVLFTNSDATIGSDEVTELSNLANGVRVWPSHDLFPSVGLPPFQQINDIKAPYGASCRSSAGTPRATGSGSVHLGARFQLDLSGAPASAPALLLIGGARSNLELNLIGAPGCYLLTTPASTLTTATGRTGSVGLPLSVPIDPDLVGGRLFAQYAILDRSANALGVATTNGVEIGVGGWIGR